MPKKVSPEYFIQLSQRVNILHKKERKDLLKVQVKRTGRHIIRAQVKRDKEKLQTRVKDRVTNLLHVY